MKIAVSASSPELSSPVDPRFGRCAYFIFVDSETLQFEAVENPNVTFSSGAGIQSAQLVASKGTNVLLTGSCGPNAFQTLHTAGVKVVVGTIGTVQDAVQQYKSGKLLTPACRWVVVYPWDPAPEWEEVWAGEWAAAWAEE